MAAVWLKLVTVLCLACTAHSVPGNSGIIWRNYGEAVTIQCRPPKPGKEYLTLKKGLNQENDVFYKAGNSEKNIIAEEYTGRLQINGAFPKIDILIKNLTSKDTGPYRCIYKKFNATTMETITKEGTGSVLLVVTDTACNPIPVSESNNNVILVTVVICAAVLLGLIMCFLISILLKTKTSRTTQKPRRVTTDDVYEDMRGTIRH